MELYNKRISLLFKLKNSPFCMVLVLYLRISQSFLLNYCRISEDVIKESVNYQTLSPRDLAKSVLSDGGWSGLLVCYLPETLCFA